MPLQLIPPAPDNLTPNVWHEGMFTTQGRRSFSLALSLCLFAPSILVVTSSAQARGRVRIGGRAISRGATYTGPVMSQAELRACLQTEKTLNSKSDEIEREERALQVRQIELNDLELRIEERKLTVDRYSQESVDSFNALIGRHRELVASYNESIRSVNEKIGSYKIEQVRFNSSCAGKSYYESDMQAVRGSLR